MILVRQVTAEDLPMIHEWAKAHDVEILEPLLSPYGFLAEDDGKPILAIWAYMILDVPVIQLDHLISAPGLKIRKVREAWEEMAFCVIQWVKNLNDKGGLNYCLIRAFIGERIGNEAERSGWEVNRQSTISIRHVIRPDSPPADDASGNH